LGRRGYQQRRNQPLRRQAPGLQRDHVGAQAGWTFAVRRHRDRQDHPSSGDSQH
jgi:hypothetical protein